MAEARQITALDPEPRLRQDGEATISFDTFIENTKADGREIIAIIDECHLAKNTDLAGDILKLVDPRIELLISATPLSFQLPTLEEFQQLRADQVTVSQADVVASGILKRSIRLAPREEIDEMIEPGSDLDYTILDLVPPSLAGFVCFATCSANAD